MTPQILEKPKAVPFIFLFCRLRKAFLGTPSNGCFNEIIITLDDDIYSTKFYVFKRKYTVTVFVELVSPSFVQRCCEGETEEKFI